MPKTKEDIALAETPEKRRHPGGKLSNPDRLELYYYMRLARECDNTILKLYRQGKIVGGAYTGNGNEATAVGSAFALQEKDYLFPMHRDLGAHLVKGQTVRNIFLQQLARANSLTGGRDGTGHYADPHLRIYGNVSHLAAMIPVAVGVALACSMRKENAVVMNYIGDGGSNVGDFHEGLNMAAVMRLPFVLVIENNQYAYSTPTTKQFVAQKLSDRALGYGIPGTTIDGTNVTLVYETCVQAVERARRGEGPTLIETITMRMHGHSASDDASYVPSEMLEDWRRKDPIDRLEKILYADRVLNDALKEQIEERIRREIDDAVTFATVSPHPPAEDAGEGVYAR
ncbi:MAG TPA: thiamine pyrophosphate-dependent dehydrogenase E1 component subunit alpha [Bacteroidota bacterium]|nr:thiamine pyrophosphate-dependent dehydrogenase E1 component subunit alpha [Bacteroidota bacterium]